MCAQGQRHSCFTSIWNRSSWHVWDSFQTFHPLKPATRLPLEKIPEQSHAGQPCYLSALTDNTTELTLPDGLYACFVALIPTAFRLWDILWTACLKNAFDSHAITRTDRRVRHDDVRKLRHLSAALSVTVVSQVISVCTGDAF